MWREPEPWRALPREVKRTVVRDVRRGVAPADPAVAAATRVWAEWTLRSAEVRLRLLAALFALGLVLAVAYRPTTTAVVVPVLLAAAALLERNRARRTLAVLDGVAR
jgi:hypothetical protein